VSRDDLCTTNIGWLYEVRTILKTRDENPFFEAHRTTFSVTIGIPTRNRGDIIADTLRSLLALPYPDSAVQILVVDQSTDTATREIVEALAAQNPRLRYLSTTTVGSSAARNLAAQSSEADIIAYTDDDCIVDPSWLAVLLQEFRDPHIAAVYGRLLPYEGGRTGLEVGFKDSDQRIVYEQRTCPWHIGHGGNMAFRRCLLLEAGGFDPTLGAGDRFGACEDGDIAYRLLAAGQSVVYNPLACAWHKHWKTWRAQQYMERCYGIGAGAQFAKYIRCGDHYGWRLLATWIWQLGVRRVAAGLLKWRNGRVVYLGYCQLLYPWIGLLLSLRCSVDKARVVYVAPNTPEA
jgi:GT2 family glycosyltransferase